MSELSKQQILLIEELKDDIEFYKEELRGQIQTTNITTYIGIGLAVIVGIILFINPSWISKIQELSDNMGMITGVIGEVLPVTFASKSFTNSKNQKKKLKGLRTFEKTIGRMETGILPNDTEHILALEEDFIEYITT